MRVISCLLLSALSATASSSRDEGIQAFRQGRYSVALAKLQQANNDHDPVAQAYLGLTQAARGNCAAALPLLRAVKQDDRDLFRLANLAAARCYSAAGDEAHTFEILDKLGRQYPNDADVLYLQAKLHMKAFNDTTFAMFQRTPDSYRVHELSAEIFETQNRYGDAVSEYRKAIAISPSASDLHFRLGRALLMQNHEPATLAEAGKAFQAELQINPEDAACEFQLGQIAQVEAQAAAARSHFERALSLSPGFVQAMIALGKIETQEKQYLPAIALLQRAVETQPANEAAHYALLTAYRDSGDLENAKAEKAKLDQLQKPPAGEFTDFLKKLGQQQPQQ